MHKKVSCSSCSFLAREKNSSQLLLPGVIAAIIYRFRKWALRKRLYNRDGEEADETSGGATFVDNRNQSDIDNSSD